MLLGSSIERFEWRGGQLKSSSASASASAAVRPLPSDLVHPRAYVRATVPSQMSPRMLKEVARALPHFPAKILGHFRQ